MDQRGLREYVCDCIETLERIIASETSPTSEFAKIAYAKRDSYEDVLRKIEGTDE